MTSAECDFYRAPGAITEPGPHAGLLDGLPTDLPRLCALVQGLMVHIFWADQYGLQLTDERRGEVQLRWVARQLSRILELDPSPLAVARPPERRLVGNCRDHSVLMAAILRHHGIPARARCGFARYFLPNHHEDHWVCEVWSQERGRWVLVDAQLDALQRERLGVAFDTCDVPRDQFLVGGEAWRRCRGGAADPDTFGIFDMHGAWVVRGNLVRDLAALNKVELLPWDSWGLILAGDEQLAPGDLDLLDRVAALTAGAPDYAALRELYEGEGRLRVPPTFRSYVGPGAQEVALDPAR